MVTRPRFLTVDQIRAKHEDLGTVTLHGTPPGDWFQRWMDDVGVLLAEIDRLHDDMDAENRPPREPNMRAQNDQIRQALTRLETEVGTLDPALFEIDPDGTIPIVDMLVRGPIESPDLRAYLSGCHPELLMHLMGPRWATTSS